MDHLNIKAFDNLTLADSVRRGVQNLLFVTGFGSMRPNTLVLGFCDDCAPQDHLQGKMIACAGYDSVSPSAVIDQERRPSTFPSVRRAGESKDLQEEKYVSVIADALKMGKNIVLARYFNQFSREEASGLGRKVGVHRIGRTPGVTWMSARSSCCSWPACCATRGPGARPGFVSFCAWRLAAV